MLTSALNARATLTVPVSGHPVDAVNLKDPRLGLYDQIGQFIDKHGVTKGRVHLQLASREQHASLTVNEYETWLMHHDLAEVLRFLGEGRLHAGFSPHPVEKTEEARIVSKRGEKRIEAEGGFTAKASRDTKLETSDRLVALAEDGVSLGDVDEDQSRAVAVELVSAVGLLDRMLILAEDGECLGAHVEGA